MSDKTNEAHVLEAALALADEWRLRGEWQDAQTLLHGLHAIAAKLDARAVARVW